MDRSDCPTNPPSEDQILIIAVLCHGLSQQAMKKDYANACGREIMSHALYWIGEWNADSRAALFQDKSHIALDRLYDRLIELCHAKVPLIRGYGNLGTSSSPPAAPTYTSFGLTVEGREVARKIRKEFGGFFNEAGLPSLD